MQRGADDGVLVAGCCWLCWTRYIRCEPDTAPMDGTIGVDPSTSDVDGAEDVTRIEGLVAKPARALLCD